MKILNMALTVDMVLFFLLTLWTNNLDVRTCHLIIDARCDNYNILFSYRALFKMLFGIVTFKIWYRL
jgi:hypothetical protein